MKLQYADRRAYPKLTEYVRVRLPRLRTNNTIVTALKKYGNMSNKQVLGALTWRHLPRLAIVDLLATPCGIATAAWGCTRSRTEIEVAKRFVKQFELNASKGEDNKNTRGTVVYVVGATILHELCHVGNKIAGVTETVEMGIEFEKAVYGKTIW